MFDAVILDAVRTPVGRFQGALSGVRPDDLASHVLRTAVERVDLDPSSIDEVFLGCANQAGEDNRNVARMAGLLAGLPDHVPGVTVNRLCASGLEAVNQAVRMIRCGDGQICLAGGVESMSRAPLSVPRGPTHPKAGNLTAWDTSLGWRYPNPRLAERFPLESMGETAENLAEQYQLTRIEQDRFAFDSHRKALHAADQGWFHAEIAPYEVRSRKGSTLVDRDESPRPDTSLERLARLPAVFRSGGSVTAGNSSPLNDGAAALVLTSAKAARAIGRTPRALVRAVASAGVDPRIMGIGPVPATRKALDLAGLSVGDIDAWELNEAFAAQSLAVLRELGLDASKVNQHGGAIALGHPLGCSGARILTTLLSVLDRIEGRFGVATLCVGVGQGVATVIERLDQNTKSSSS
ncbi:MAG: thiolase family protein [Deltaproteobacteria bacterium]|nr:MAG: thiolase family protein [Deltaproteobacteria bacterium]